MMVHIVLPGTMEDNLRVETCQGINSEILYLKSTSRANLQIFPIKIRDPFKYLFPIVYLMRTQSKSVLFMNPLLVQNPTYAILASVYLDSPNLLDLTIRSLLTLKSAPHMLTQLMRCFEPPDQYISLILHFVHRKVKIPPEETLKLIKGKNRNHKFVISRLTKRIRDYTRMFDFYHRGPAY